MKYVIVAMAIFAMACSNAVKKDEPPPCGNGRLDSGEVCDWGIADGEDGACPTECVVSGDACTSVALVGDARSCTAECVVNEPSCGEGDGCCPVGCDSTGDADCSNTCGDGLTEGSETCDGDCPTTCDDRDACTVDSFTGSAETCSLTCDATPITECAGGDGCCAPGCTATNDTDCSASCGNGQLDPGELCDGDCPTSCDDGVACTEDRPVGAAATCNVQCINDPITVCAAGDGCCPDGCSSANDADCACVPRTCDEMGWTCGSLDTGCNSTVSCGTCLATQMCDGGTCVEVPANRGIGSACTSDNDCNSGFCLSEAGNGMPGGYCVAVCDGLFNQCAEGTCVGGRCLKECGTDSDCRTGYECYATLGSTVNACQPVGLGARTVGQSCTTSMDCAGGENVFCEGPAAGYKNGYCQKYCDTNNPCPFGSHCAFDDDVFGSAVVGVCLRDCASNASCRGNGADGYMCYDADDDGASECFVAGTGNGAVGGPCDGPWDCDGGAWGRCGSEKGGGFPDGYCSIACGTDQGDCPFGSHCGTTVITGFCVADCVLSTQCRAGYTCQDDGTIDACWPP